MKLNVSCTRNHFGYTADQNSFIYWKQHQEPEKEE